VRFPRLAQAAALVVLATAPIAAVSLPALADSPRQSEWWLGKLHVIQAWRTGEGSGVTIAVLADGVDARQADLTGSVIKGPDFTRSGRAASGPYYGVIGTGLASLIAGHGHGRKAANGNYVDGIYGVADEAKILSVRVTLSPRDPLWSSSRVTSRLPADIAAGIRYAVQHKASVIELPADPGMPGIAGWGGASAAAGGSPAERSAIAAAIRHNVVLVAPAGDNGQAGDAPNYPAAYQGVVAVGAVGKDFVKARYSSRRSYVALTAAGQGVAAAAPAGYQTMNTTWAASSIVAGVAGLVRSQFPNLTAAQVLKAMAKGTHYRPHNGVLDGSGYGTVDARLAITRAGIMSPPHARPASLGALPRRQPVTPSVPSQGSVIARDLMQDGAISAGALVGLLIPITFYGSVSRRRERREAQAAAERDRAARIRADHGMPDDPLLKFFGPQHAPPAGLAAGQRPAVSPRYQPRPGLTGRSTLSPAFAARPMLAAPPAGADQANGSQLAMAGSQSDFPGLAAPAEPPRAAAARSGRDTSAAAGEPDAWTGAEAGLSPSGQIPAGSPRAPQHVPVVGSPPWEPAPRPTSELPWAVIPGPQAGAVRHRGPGEAPYATASAAPRSLFDPDPAEHAPDGRSERGRRTDSSGHPIYIWNPGSAGAG